MVFGATHKPASWGRGIIDDIKQTLGTHWDAEMSNLNVRTFAVSLYIFFACIAPAITFGAMYAKFTNDFIGPVEMITATAWCGIVYALIGGQVRFGRPAAALWWCCAVGAARSRPHRARVVAVCARLRR